MSGLSPIRHRIVDNLAEEQILLNIVGGIFGSLVSLFLFRSFWIGALNGVAPAFALLFTLGAFGLFGINMNVNNQFGYGTYFGAGDGGFHSHDT